MSNKKTKEIAIISLIIFLSSILTMLSAEIAYRAYLYSRGVFDVGFKVASSMYYEFDEDHLVRYLPERKHTTFNITNGKISWCPEVLSSTNKDGMVGKTTIDEYYESEIKILVFGDSFTHWNLGEGTWPDFMQVSIQKKLNKRIGILNFGVSGVGILHMIERARIKIDIFRPDFVIFAFITDDLTRPTKKWKNSNVKGSSAGFIVNTNVNLEWCNRLLKNGQEDDLLKQINSQYNRQKKEWMEASGITENTILSLTQSYLANRIIYKHHFAPSKRLGYSRIHFNNYDQDSDFIKSLKNIKSYNIPFVFIHLPIEIEIKKRKLLLTKQRSLLLNSLEELSKSKIVYLFDRMGHIDIPHKVNLAPHDNHPNMDGLKFYSNLVSEYVLDTYMTSWNGDF